jgi:hypothetical protein
MGLICPQTGSRQIEMCAFQTITGAVRRRGHRLSPLTPCSKPRNCSIKLWGAGTQPWQIRRHAHGLQHSRGIQVERRSQRTGKWQPSCFIVAQDREVSSVSALQLADRNLAFFTISSLEISSKQYLQIRFLAHRKHITSPLQSRTG